MSAVVRYGLSRKLVLAGFTIGQHNDFNSAAFARRFQRVEREIQHGCPKAISIRNFPVSIFWNLDQKCHSKMLTLHSDQSLNFANRVRQPRRLDRFDFLPA